MYRPARRPNRLQPAHMPAGMHSSPNTSDRACVADSLAPNDAHPDVQEQVEQRRRAVVAQDAGDRAQRVRRDARGDRLVLPELADGRAQVARADERGDRDQHDQHDGRADPDRDALEPLRLPDVGYARDAARRSGDGGHLAGHL